MGYLFVALDCMILIFIVILLYKQRMLKKKVENLVEVNAKVFDSMCIFVKNNTDFLNTFMKFRDETTRAFLILIDSLSEHDKEKDGGEDIGNNRMN